MSADEGETDLGPLLPEEIRELATLYSTPTRAEVLLRSAGYPPDALPYAAATSGDYWEQVSLNLTAGVMVRGRQRILAKAHERHRYNLVFRSTRMASTPRSTPTAGRIKVMVLGAEPARRGEVRAPAELREIQSAHPDRLEVVSCPAATPADLERIRTVRPDVLHLACHGDSGRLLLEDQDGEAHFLPATDLVETLRLAADHLGHRLRALLLRSCESAEIAGLFTGVADVVIAHQGALDAACSVLYAGAFYRELASNVNPLTPESLSATARIAAQDAVNRAGCCHSLRTDLIVLPETS
ncbi:CHAT domain-containing protein [Streptomyces sp. NPDC056656]|uniref:CHAT domain-containing protein n=1 Tax=Streptomyces sp. NPDC056656 TaxID=3345895 RepID=UPI00368C73B5